MEGENQYAALLARAMEIVASAEGNVSTRRTVVGDAKQELQLAATWHLRRASVPLSIDNLTYAHGSNERALGGLDICPIALLGFKAAGAIAYPWLVDAAALLPSGNYVDHVRVALDHRQRWAYCVELGAYHRFQFKSEVYRNAVFDWQARPAANDPTAPWRRRSITAKQRYLIEIVVDCLAAISPSFQQPHLANRGAAHDWLRDVGGRPMFWHRPVPPASVFGGEQ